MSFDPTSIPLAAQRNAKMQADAFADLNSWTSSIKQTDSDLKKKETTGNKVVAQIRSKRQKHVVRVDSEGSEIEDDSCEEDQEEEERVKMAAEYKDEGNAHFKAGGFEKAVECYTMAQSLDVTNPVYPANRAMANLKLKNWMEAEEDCTRALRHDPTYEKALFRRAQARDQLGKLEGAEKDYLEVLKLDPKNKAAKKEKDALNKRLHKKIKFSTERPEKFSKTKLKEIKINEVNKPQSVIDKENKEREEARKIIEARITKTQDETPAKPLTVPKIEPVEIPKPIESSKINTKSTTEIPNPKPEKLDEEKTPEKINFTKPATSFEMERDWRSLKTQKQKADYLLFIDDAESVARYFAPQLPKYIIDICSVMGEEMSSDLNECRMCIEILKEISKVPRFKTSLFFLLDTEKEIIRNLFDKIGSKAMIPENLKSSFLL